MLIVTDSGNIPFHTENKRQFPGSRCAAWVTSPPPQPPPSTGALFLYAMSSHIAFVFNHIHAAGVLLLMALNDTRTHTKKEFWQDAKSRKTLMCHWYAVWSDQTEPTCPWGHRWALCTFATYTTWALGMKNAKTVKECLKMTLGLWRAPGEQTHTDTLHKTKDHLVTRTIISTDDFGNKMSFSELPRSLSCYMKLFLTS